MLIRRTTPQGFTIVELLIVIVVIAILAAITIISYNGITQRAYRTSLQSDLKNAGSTVGVVVSDGSPVPATLPSQTKASSGNVLQLTDYVGSGGEFCINGMRGNPSFLMSWRSDGGLQDGLCPALPKGSTVGGTMPTIPRGINLSPGLADWTRTNGTGITYNSSSDEFVLTNGGVGTYQSSKIRIDGAGSVTIKLSIYATIAATAAGCTPTSCAYVGIAYFGADGVTPVQNTGGYTTNGNAQAKPLNAWGDYSWTPATGSNVSYVYVTINAGAGYTSNNRIKNIQIIANS